MSDDKYHAMALIAAGAGGLAEHQVAGLAHIFRQIARDENEACAEIAEEFARAPEWVHSTTNYTAPLIAKNIRARTEG